MNTMQYLTLTLNESARKVLEYILENAAQPRWYTDDTCTVICIDCGMEVDSYECEDGSGEDWMLDKNNHREECLYRMALEFLANLDNTGYEFTLPTNGSK